MMLSVLGVFEDIATWPAFASHIVWELYEDQGSFFVLTMFQGEELTLPGCSNVLCPFEEFENIITSVIPSN